MRELTLLYAPNINSYKRYQPARSRRRRSGGAWTTAPAALRLVGHGPSLRVENRVPGGDVNPYLASAA
jgi:glutamine synthetase